MGPQEPDPRSILEYRRLLLTQLDAGDKQVLSTLMEKCFHTPTRGGDKGFRTLRPQKDLGKLGLENEFQEYAFTYANTMVRSTGGLYGQAKALRRLANSIGPDKAKAETIGTLLAIEHIIQRPKKRMMAIFPGLDTLLPDLMPAQTQAEPSGIKLMGGVSILMDTPTMTRIVDSTAKMVSKEIITGQGKDLTLHAPPKLPEFIESILLRDASPDIRMQLGAAGNYAILVATAHVHGGEYIGHVKRIRGELDLTVSRIGEDAGKKVAQEYAKKTGAKLHKL